MKTHRERNAHQNRNDGIVALAHRRLRETGQASLRTVRLTFVDDVLVLTGQVPTRYERYLAEETVTSIPGVEYVDNALEIEHRGPVCPEETL